MVVNNPINPDSDYQNWKAAQDTQEIIKVCTNCGKRYTRDTWAMLPIKGIQDGGGNGYPDLEMRQCPCNNTLVLELDLLDKTNKVHSW
jgi:hypothetical protein